MPLFLLTVFGKGKRLTSANLSAMTWPNSPIFYSSIKQGLSEAIDYSESKLKKAIIHKFIPLDVKIIRVKVGMSQSEFASAFGISVSTLRHWEHGDRTPQDPALVLLNAVAKEPEIVLRTLAS